MHRKNSLASPTPIVTADRLFVHFGHMGTAALDLAGKVAWSQSKKEDAIQRLSEAVQLEDEMPYMEPPFWYYPVRQSLGAALLQTGKPAAAEQVFREDLKHFPNCGWPLFGLEASLRNQDKTAEAQQVRRQFKRAWRYADTKLDWSWF